ncbi:MAG: hypothetical protein U0176_27135 [Bacteroidia bacterium]
MRKYLLVTVLAGVAVLGFAGCKDKLERVPCNGTSPTWDAKVLDIVAESCWGSNCHGNGSQRGDYTSFAGIQPTLQNGTFETEVLETRRMPQDGSLPDSTLATLQCWLENGFPEN